MASHDSPNFEQCFLLTKDSIGPLKGANLPTGSDGNAIKSVRAFVTDTDGTVTVQPLGSPTPVTLGVKAGVIMRLAIKQFCDTSTTMNVFGLI